MDIISKSACVWMLPRFLQRIHDQNNRDRVIIVLKCVGIQAVFDSAAGMYIGMGV